MLVAIRPAGDHREGLSGAEVRFAEMLRSWTGQHAVPGVAFCNVSVPHSYAGRRQVDAVVFTPHGVVVLEVKGFTQRQQGTLDCPRDGSWTVDGTPALLHTQATVNPLQQLDTNVYAVRNALSEGGLDPGFVAGLVVIVPAKPSDIALSTARGTDVVLAEHTALRRYFHQQARRRSTWNAGDVLDAAGALGLREYSPERAQLTADGFTDPTAPASAQAREEPPTPPAGLRRPEVRVDPEHSSFTPEPEGSPRADEPSPAPPRRGLVHHGGVGLFRRTVAVLVAAAAVVAVVALAVFIHGLFHP